MAGDFLKIGLLPLAHDVERVPDLEVDRFIHLVVERRCCRGVLRRGARRNRRQRRALDRDRDEGCSGRATRAIYFEVIV
jgi:hypothetical protein